MNRLVWLLLSVCCLALVQVQPVARLAPMAESCGCCDCDGACGMPDCAPPTPARAPVYAQESTRATEGLRLRRVARPMPAFAEAHAAFIRLTIPGIALATPVRLPPTASAPLFRLHCSYLI
jgi:hypothetical protein